MINRPSPTDLIAATLLTGVVASLAPADTITVCLDGTCDFTDPAAAAAVAMDGDVIEIAAGTYLLDSPINLYGPSVEIRGAVDGKGRPATILDGQGIGQVLAIVLLPQSTCGIENLVITNGFAEYGGGMFLRDGAYTFENCRITGNHAESQGGGLFLNGDADVTFVACEISGNTAAHPTFQTLGQGGGAWISEGVVTFVDSEIRGNSAQHAGGALGMSPLGEVVLDGGRICGNVSGQSSGQIVGAGTVTIVAGCISDHCVDCPTSPPCPADLDGNGSVDGADLASMLASWGACKQGCAADLDGSGTVNGADLAILLGAWGACG